MYKELDKYKTGRRVQTIGVSPDGQEIKMCSDEYIFHLGDLIKDFIKHQNKPKWKRKYYHDHLTDIYMRTLNEIEIKIGF